MDLSATLKKQFAKLAAPKEVKTINKLYGTVHAVEGQAATVQIDGSDIATPVTSLVDIQDGDRVTLSIINHKIVIDGNVSRPTDSALDEVAELQEELDNLDITTLVQIVDEYCLATENYIPEGQTFEDIRYTEWVEDITELTWQSGYFFWHRQKFIFSDGSITYSDPWFDAVVQITYESDKAVEDAMQAAEDANDVAEAANAVANQKRRVFNSTPTPPYDLNDMWFDGPQGEAKICIRAKTKNQSYADSDWQLATKYTDDSTVNALKNHFWYDSSGAHVAQTQGDVTSGYAQTIASTGIAQTYNGKLVTSWTNTGLNFYDNSGSSAVLVASYAKGGYTHYVKGKRMMSLTDSGLALYKSDGSTLMAGFLSTGVTFANDVPFTIGNNNSYIKWVKENNTWKIKIAADEIEMGGSSLDTGGDYIKRNLVTKGHWDAAFASSPSGGWTKESSSTLLSYNETTGLMKVYCSGSWYTIYQAIAVKANTKYTISAKVGSSYHIAFSTSAATNSELSGWTTASDGRVYTSVTTGSSTTYYITVIARSSSYSYVNNIKVEEGDYSGWYSEEGEKGDTGATGATGPQGPKGDKGDAGDSKYVVRVSSNYGIRVYTSYSSGEVNTSSYAEINSSNILMVAGGTQYASFGSTTTIGYTSYYNLQLSSSGIDFRSGTSTLGRITYQSSVPSESGGSVSDSSLCMGYGTSTDTAVYVTSNYRAILRSYYTSSTYASLVVKGSTPSIVAYINSSSISASAIINSTSFNYSTTNALATVFCNSVKMFDVNSRSVAVNGVKYAVGLATDDYSFLVHQYHAAGSSDFPVESTRIIGHGSAGLHIWESGNWGSYVHLYRTTDGNAYFQFRPLTTNGTMLGGSSHRWKQIWCNQSDINSTSDLKCKRVVEDHDWKVDEFIMGLKPIAFYRIDENTDQEEGELNMGFGAQDVYALTKSLNLGDLSICSATIKGNVDDGHSGEIEYHGEDIDDQYLYWSLQYNQLIAPIVLELQRLMKRVEDLERSTAL